MPDTCTFDVGLNGLQPDAVGLPTRLQLYARRHGVCDRVQLLVRQTQGGLVLFSDIVTPDSNGTCIAEFALPGTIFPCGFRLWVEARCVDGGTCEHGAMVPIDCKARPGAGGSSNPNNPNNSDDDWPWGLPPVLFCPLMGQRFTLALLMGLIGLVTSVAFVIPVGVAAAGVIIAGAFAILAVWRRWCPVSFCSLWGAVLWALKRAVIGGVILSILGASVPAFLLSIAMGAMAGMITAKLRSMRCRLPSAMTPLSQLPLW